MSEIDKSDELEYASLQSSISSAERALRSSGGTSTVLRNFVENAKARMGFVEKKINEAKEKDARVEEEAKAYLTHKQEVERETALSKSEKQTYDSFLREDFFTKKEFGRLDQFYSKTWDRLSEHGKDEMDHRLWEGIRKNEFTFSELPQSVREKTAERAYKHLNEPTTGNAPVISEKDRRDFVRTYENGRLDEASKVLDRESFKQNMALKIRNTKSQSKGAELASTDTNTVSAAQNASEKRSVADLDITSIDLKDLKMNDPNSVASKDVPRAEKDSVSVQR